MQPIIYPKIKTHLFVFRILHLLVFEIFLRYIIV